MYLNIQSTPSRPIYNIHTQNGALESYEKMDSIQAYRVDENNHRGNFRVLERQKFLSFSSVLGVPWHSQINTYCPNV